MKKYAASVAVLVFVFCMSIGLLSPALAQAEIEGLYSVQGTNPDGSTYKGQARMERKEQTYLLTWMISGQTFSGRGLLKGDVLSIEWTSGTEGGLVVYTVRPDGVLDGVWAGGKGKEILTPLGTVGGVTAEAPNIEGAYWVKGTNPNGSTYAGEARIKKLENGYQMSWNIGGQGFSGTGRLKGNILSVKWTSGSEGGLVVYTVKGDGVLDGVWAGGKGKEILTPK